MKYPLIFPAALATLASVGTVHAAGAPTLLPGGWTPEALRTAASLARGSRHPLARALAAACPDAPLRPDAREHPGLGMAAGDLRLGSARFCGQAEAGILFSPPDNVVAEFPQYPVVRDYAALRTEIDRAFARAG